MSTGLREQLERLAPAVDPSEEWTRFERRRHRKRRRRALGAGAASSVLVVVIVLGGYALLDGDDSQLVETGPLANETVEPDATDGTDGTDDRLDTWAPEDDEAPGVDEPTPSPGSEDRVSLDHRVVTIVEPSGFVDPENPFRLHDLAAEIQVLVAQAGLDDLWHLLGLDRLTHHHDGSPPPQVDFDHHVAFVVTEGRPAECADTLRLEPEGPVLWFRFEPFEGGCRLRQGWSVYVVTAARDQLPDEFTIVRDYVGLVPPGGRVPQQVTLPPGPD